MVLRKHNEIQNSCNKNIINKKITKQTLFLMNLINPTALVFKLILHLFSLHSIMLLLCLLLDCFTTENILLCNLNLIMIRTKRLRQINNYFLWWFFISFIMHILNMQTSNPPLHRMSDALSTLFVCNVSKLF